MDLFWKTSASILISLILILTLQKQSQDMALLLTTVVCVLAGIASIQTLLPVLDFLYELHTLVSMEDHFLKLLLKIAGIGLVAELVCLLCADAGNSSLGKTVHFLASSVILYLSIPILQGMLDLLQDVLGGL